MIRVCSGQDDPSFGAVHRVRRRGVLQAFLVLFAVTSVAVQAHFQLLIPSPALVSADTGRTVGLRLVFTHPMQDGPAMPMGEPRAFGVTVGETTLDLRSALDPTSVDGQRAYRADCRIARPGDHVFHLEPAPYWEPAEGKMIVHYTKVVVNAYGEESGWDRMVGFPVEIRPLTRPYGLWSGNLFRGVVLQDGKPVPYAEVEVEHLNLDQAVGLPADVFSTQVVKADASGVFSYAMPRAGWWGFAALVDGPEPMRNPDGKLVDVELGALIWVQCADMIP